jgi:hypothetical protein
MRRACAGEVEDARGGQGVGGEVEDAVEAAGVRGRWRTGRGVGVCAGAEDVRREVEDAAGFWRGVCA